MIVFGAWHGCICLWIFDWLFWKSFGKRGIHYRLPYAALSLWFENGICNFEKVNKLNTRLQNYRPSSFYIVYQVIEIPFCPNNQFNTHTVCVCVCASVHFNNWHFRHLLNAYASNAMHFSPPIKVHSVNVCDIIEMRIYLLKWNNRRQKNGMKRSIICVILFAKRKYTE